MHSRQTISTAAFSVLALYLLVLLGQVAHASLLWGYVHDSPLMIYVAFLMDQGAVPYRDVFDMNTPGIYFFMWCMGKLLGWDNASFRYLDLACLCILMVCSFVTLRRFGILSAIIGPSSFALWYLSLGPELSVQREFLGVVLLSVILATLSLGMRWFVQAAVVGFCGGVMCLIKPQFFIFAFPLCYVMSCCDGLIVKSVSKRLLVALLFFFLPLLATTLYLGYSGGLLPFIDIASNYWSLYASLSGDYITVDSSERVRQLVTSLANSFLNFFSLWVVLILMFLADHRLRQLTGWLAGSLLALSFLYPAIGGKFWMYHWMPFFYISSLIASLGATSLLSWTTESVVSKLAYIVAIFTVVNLAEVGVVKYAVLPAEYKKGAPEKISRYLVENLKTGDMVQPLDWTAGAVHAMLLAKAPLATRFMYDFHFYHHVDHPYILALRREFVQQFVSSRPRFVIQMLGINKPWPGGKRATKSFPELEEVLEDSYQVVREEAEFKILERLRS